MTEPRSSGSAVSTLALVLLVAVLFAVNWAIQATPFDISPIEPPHVRAGAPLPATAAPTLPETAEDAPSTAEMLARPLFRPDRRPYMAKPAVAETAPPAEPPRPAEAVAEPPLARPAGLRLVGIFGVKTGDRQALIKTDGWRDARLLAPGADVEGWTLVRIDMTSATLSSREETLRLELFSSAADAAVPTPTAH